MDLSLRRAERHDVPAAQAAYRAIIDHLAATVDFPHWHTENHPIPDEVAAWIEAGELYLAITRAGADRTDTQPETIAGVAVLNHDAAEQYADATWAIDATPDEVLVVHALGVVPAFLGRGVARHLVESSLQLARDWKLRTVRLDTYVENIPARRLYARCGFHDLGCHTVRYEGTDLSQFHLFEYVL
ncbi:GNAT family N-acetyltransferase [Brachybacterium sp. AOP29-B2-41]|uniref:GNAT family N-acetyltransferase n=1 Tax=Brachybacterium sp. AOP29-B2-41 TaxID=3457704 RepID=UPI004034A838